LGTLAFYLGTALAASFYLRRWIGRRTWRLLHYATYLVFGLALAHGVRAGTDSNLDAVRWMYVSTGAVLLFVTLVRVLTMRRTGAAAGVHANQSRPQRSGKTAGKTGLDDPVL
jgi:DMSO/TMAO reductase YedYZ heme-binding membrane subunit